MRRHEPHAGETLTEIQSLADRLGEWLSRNWIYPTAVLGVVLALTGLGAGIYAWRDRAELKAADAVARVEREFLAAMGAQPGAREFEEPANAETARKARTEAADKLLAIAREHPRTSAALQAQMEAGELLAKAGNGAQALELWRGLLATGDVSPELQALILVRIAQTEEEAGRWSEAAKAYLAAGEQRAYPLWPWALADAARSLVEAGDRDQAVRIAQRLRIDAPQQELPPHLAALLEELQAQGPTSPQS